MKIGLPVPEKKIFEGFLPYMDMAAILVLWQSSCLQIFISLYLKAFIQNLVQNGPVVSTGVNQKVLPVLSTETLLHIWLSTEYYGCRPSSTVVDTVSLHALDPTVPRKRMQIGFLLAPIVKEVSNIVSNLLMSFLLQRLTLEFV